MQLLSQAARVGQALLPAGGMQPQLGAGGGQVQSRKRKKGKGGVGGGDGGGGDGGDAQLPKRHTNAFMQFCKARRKELGEQLQGRSSRVVVQELGEAWSQLPALEKKKYEDMAKVDQERYKAEMAAMAGPQVQVPT